MEVVERRLDTIRPYERNPRRNDQAVDAVAASIREFGFKVPLVINADGVIVTGHTRYKAAQRLGLKTVPCVIASDLSEEQIKAFRLADNKVAEQSTWDFDKLRAELAECAEDMRLYGFSGDDLFPGNLEEGYIENEEGPEREAGEQEKRAVVCPRCGGEAERRERNA